MMEDEKKLIDEILNEWVGILGVLNVFKLDLKGIVERKKGNSLLFQLGGLYENTRMEYEKSQLKYWDVLERLKGEKVNEN